MVAVRYIVAMRVPPAYKTMQAAGASETVND